MEKKLPKGPENATNRISERLKFKISRGGGMPPNPPSNSRLPRLAVWSGYGTGIYCFSIEKCSLNAPLRYMLENINVTCLAYLCYVSSCFNKLHWFHYVLILVKVKALLFRSKTSLSVKTSNLVKMSTNYV